MNAKFINKASHVLILFVFVIGLISVPGRGAQAQEPAPHIAIRLDGSPVVGSEWPFGTLVTMTIDDLATPQPVDFTAQRTSEPNPQNPNELIASFDLSEGFILEAGHVITMTGGGTTVIYAIPRLQATSIDVQGDTVSGVDTAGAQVDVRANAGDHSVWRHIPVNGSGNWIADFQHPGNQEDEQEILDLQFGAHGGVSEMDAIGNSTTAYWVTPYISAEPIGDWISGREWRLGAPVTINIDNPSTPESPDFTTTQTAAIPGRVGGDFHYDSTYDFSVGDTITLTDGVTTKSLIVSPIKFTLIDQVNDRIAGITSPNRTIRVYVNNEELDPQSDENGNWSADFAGKTDISPSMSCSIKVLDDDADMTHGDCNLPPPYFFARMGQNRVEAFDWPVGHSLTLSINDLTTPQVPDYTDAQVVTAAPDDPLSGTAAFQLDGFSLRAGQVIEITDGEQSQTLTVADVAVTTVEVVHDVISGTAGPGIAQVIVRIWSSPDNLSRLVDVVNGQWCVDFSVPGDQPNESQTWDIQPGDNGIVRVGDPSGNVTTNYWEAPIAVNQLTALSPARIWIGLKNSDDIGTKFDLLVEVYQNNALVGSGELDKVNGGSSGFNNAKLNSIPLTLFAPVSWPTGSTLSTKLYVRNTCYGNTHNSGTTRLWYDDASANSQFAATIASVVQSYFIRDGFALSLTPGTGPKKTIDLAAGKPCSAFKPFGTWSITP